MLVDVDALAFKTASFSLNFLWKAGLLALRISYSAAMTVTYYTFNYPKYIFVAIVLILIAGLFIDEDQLRKDEEKRTLAKDALIALQTVITPTFGYWTYGYDSSLISIRTRRFPPQSRTESTEDSDSELSDLPEEPAPITTIKTISVPILKFLDDSLNGYVEFRSPHGTEDFLFNRLQVHDWRIRIKAEPACFTRLISWMVTSQQSSLQPETYLESTPNACLQYIVALDVVPYADISRILRLLDSKLHTGCSAAIYFSTIVSDLNFLGPEYIACAVPFFLREHSSRRPVLPDGALDKLENLHGIFGVTPTTAKWEPEAPSNSLPRKYTSTPLLLSLVNMMRHLATDAPGLHVESVKDLSVDVRNILVREEQRYADDWRARAHFNRKHGNNLRVLREERLMLAWEAGLLGNGNLQRWCIKVKKPHRRIWAQVVS